MEKETKEAMKEATKEEGVECDFSSLTDRRQYFQDHPEIFPEMISSQPKISMGSLSDFEAKFPKKLKVLQNARKCL